MAAREGALRRVGRGPGWLVLAAVAALLALQRWYLGHIVWWKSNPPASTSFMRAQLEVLREQDPNARLQHRWVPSARISPHLKRAVIAAEDASFTAHEGVDWEAIERGFERNLQRGRVTHGGSTITMQLAKNLFVSSERSDLRKAQELVITFMLEAVLDKDRILDLYLNVAEWGVGVFGCEAAARRHFGVTAGRRHFGETAGRRHFGVSAAQLTPAQAARLAAMLPRPRHDDRKPGSAALARRASTIQRWMGSVGTP